MLLIVDIDGTLSDYSHRLHLINKDIITKADFKAFLEPSLVEKDVPYPNAREGLLKLMSRASRTFFVTSRQDYLREVTERWLRTHMGIVAPDGLIMRQTGNLGIATEHKLDILKKHIFPVADEQSIPIMVFVDDDPYVLNLYSKYGITLRAPDCWDLLIHPKPDKTEEIFSK